MLNSHGAFIMNPLLAVVCGSNKSARTPRRRVFRTAMHLLVLSVIATAGCNDAGKPPKASQTSQPSIPPIKSAVQSKQGKTTAGAQQAAGLTEDQKRRWEKVRRELDGFHVAGYFGSKKQWLIYGGDWSPRLPLIKFKGG